LKNDISQGFDSDSIPEATAFQNNLEFINNDGPVFIFPETILSENKIEKLITLNA
jgi:hypothetical protein